MPKLICGLSKMQKGASGNRSAAVSVEVELDAATLRDGAKLKQHIRCGFDRIREAIEEELARAGPETAPNDTKGCGQQNGHPDFPRRPR